MSNTIGDVGLLKKMTQMDGTCTYAPGAFTPQYAAQEIKRNQLVDAKSDLFSFGVLMAVIYDQSEPGMYDDKPECNAAPLWFRELLERMLRDEPEERPSAEDVQHTLLAHPPEARTHVRMHIHAHACMHTHTPSAH